jgi:hypothetical protein
MHTTALPHVSIDQPVVSLDSTAEPPSQTAAGTAAATPLSLRATSAQSAAKIAAVVERYARIAGVDPSPSREDVAVEARKLQTTLEYSLRVDDSAAQRLREDVSAADIDTEPKSLLAAWRDGVTGLEAMLPDIPPKARQLGGTPPVPSSIPGDDRSVAAALGAMDRHLVQDLDRDETASDKFLDRKIGEIASALRERARSSSHYAAVIKQFDLALTAAGYRGPAR